jgi:hypothetical protein
MHIVFERPDSQRLVAKLREGDTITDITGWRPEQAAADLLAALDAAESEGYGECFWPEPTGQYWWILKREDRRLEVVVLYSRGGAMGWQHVFRAVDEVDYLQDLVRTELDRHRLAP